MNGNNNNNKTSADTEYFRTKAKTHENCLMSRHDIRLRNHRDDYRARRKSSFEKIDNVSSTILVGKKTN